MKIAETSLPFAAAALLLAGCGYSTKAYRYQGAAALEPREANCALQIYTAKPKEKHSELGVVEFTPRAMGHLPSTEQEAREKAYVYACAAGGNGLLLVHDLKGSYTKATILKVQRKGENQQASR
jgi:hypothetical protein